MIIGYQDQPTIIIVQKDLVQSLSVIFDVYLYNEFTQVETLMTDITTCQDRQYRIDIDLLGLVLGDYEFRLKVLNNIVYKEKMKII